MQPTDNQNPLSRVVLYRHDLLEQVMCNSLRQLFSFFRSPKGVIYDANLADPVVAQGHHQFPAVRGSIQRQPHDFETADIDFGLRAVVCAHDPQFKTHILIYSCTDKRLWSRWEAGMAGKTPSR